MNDLPPRFVFSQSSLADYVACARRFQLRYIERLRWPAVESEPMLERERHMQQGTDFHHRVHQHLIGIPVMPLAEGDRVGQWWSNYVNSGFTETLPAHHLPETTRAVSISGHKLVAQYDLLALDDTRAVIVDWKTSHRRPRDLAERMQTRVYRYVLARTLDLPPERVEMIYWFAEYPDQPERLPYDAAQYARDHDDLHALIGEIAARKVFDLTTDTRRCQFCTYRSLCDRGIEAGDALLDDLADMGEAGGLDDFDFDFDQVAEVEF